jgi:hypothetical protein
MKPNNLNQELYSILANGIRALVFINIVFNFRDFFYDLNI